MKLAGFYQPDSKEIESFDSELIEPRRLTEREIENFQENSRPISPEKLVTETDLAKLSGEKIGFVDHVCYSFEPGDFTVGDESDFILSFPTEAGKYTLVKTSAATVSATGEGVRYEISVPALVIGLTFKAVNGLFVADKTSSVWNQILSIFKVFITIGTKALITWKPQLAVLMGLFGSIDENQRPRLPWTRAKERIEIFGYDVNGYPVEEYELYRFLPEHIQPDKFRKGIPVDPRVTKIKLAFADTNLDDNDGHGRLDIGLLRRT